MLSFNAIKNILNIVSLLSLIGLAVIAIYATIQYGKTYNELARILIEVDANKVKLEIHTQQGLFDLESMTFEFE